MSGLDRATIALGASLAPAVAFVSTRIIDLQAAASWSAAKVAIALSMVRGYALYYGPGEGPVSDWMYGPVAALLWLPSALLSGPQRAVTVSVALGVGMQLASVLWVHIRSARISSDAPWLGVWGFAIFYSFLAIPAVLSFAYGFGATSVGLTLATGATALLLVPIDRTQPGTLFASAVLAVLAVWTKQTLAPLLLALPMYVGLAYGRRPSLRYLIYIGASGLLLSLVFVALFGLRAIYFGAFMVPAACPWRLSVLVGGLVLLQRNAVLIGLLLVGTAFTLTLDRKAVSASSAPWLRSRPWAAFLLVGIFMIPTSILGRLKVGASSTSDLSTFFLAMAVSLQLSELVVRPARRWLPLAPRILVLGLLVANVVQAGTALGPHLEKRGERRAQMEQALAFATDHPGEVYFPANPLITLLSEGAFYHFEAGLWTRDSCGFPVSEEHLLRYLPEHLRFVVYDAAPVWPAGHALRRLPQFSRRVELGDLPGFEVYVRNRSAH